MKYNIYCDESCHLKNDKNNIMVIGGIYCPKEKAKTINQSIKKLKQKHNISTEIKWRKVSNNKIEFYKELIEYFFNNKDLKFRCVIATEKNKLNLNKFNLTYDDWYYRIYYLLLKEIINIEDEYFIYMDIKDTLGSKKINKLKTVLNNMLFSFYEETVKKIQLVRSEEIEIIQLTDILIGAVSYINREINNFNAKSELINLIKKRSSQNIKNTTFPKIWHNKFDIFRWKPKTNENKMQHRK